MLAVSALGLLFAISVVEKAWAVKAAVVSTSKKPLADRVVALLAIALKAKCSLEG